MRYATQGWGKDGTDMGRSRELREKVSNTSTATQEKTYLHTLF